jgi:uncharacterized protein (DUF983 family)
MPLPDPEKGITGFCPCCGEPRVFGILIHDDECIWDNETEEDDCADVSV